MAGDRLGAALQALALGSQQLNHDAIVEAISFTIGGGVTLRGHRRGAGDEWVILIHDHGRDLDVWSGLPAMLAGDDYSVLAMDLPGHGLSDDPVSDVLLDTAVQAMVDQVPPVARSVFIVAEGVSVGVAMKATRGRAIDALVALSPSAVGLDDHRAMSCPKLFLAGVGDQAALQQTNRAFRESGGWAVLSTFPVTEQGADLLSGSWGTQAAEQILLFLRDYRALRT